MFHSQWKYYLNLKSNPLTFAPTPEMPMPIRRANLPTFSEISASVLADEAWVQGEQESLDLVRELVSINQSKPF